MENKFAVKLRFLNRLCPIKGKEGSVKVGADVIVQTDRGTEIGKIVSFERGFPKFFRKDVKLKKVVRYATEEDTAKAKELLQREKEARKIGNQKIKEFELEIKILAIEYIFDEMRLVYYFKLKEGSHKPKIKQFTRDLSTALKVRIEMQQVNPREEALFFNTFGPCGQPLCCRAWIGKNKHVTVKMVKDQGLQLSANKTSGMCGRLMCCLSYEYEGAEKKHD